MEYASSQEFLFIFFKTKLLTMSHFTRMFVVKK